jgi:hypothetical protein
MPSSLPIWQYVIWSLCSLLQRLLAIHSKSVESAAADTPPATKCGCQFLAVSRLH